MIDIIDRVVGEETFTALRFGSDKYDIPTHLTQSQRESCLLITDTDITSFPWYGIEKDKNGQYLILPHSTLEEFWTIKDKNRKEALSLIRKIAIGIKKGGKKFSDLNSGIFPLYRIFIKDGKDILLLPPDAASVLAVSLSREESDRCVKNLIKKDTENGYTLASEMMQLLYYAASSTFPYEKEEVRRSGYNEIPLEYYTPTLNSNVLNFISNNLSLSEKKQRKLSGNLGPENTLGWFLDETKDLEWNLENRTEDKAEKEKTITEENQEFKKLWEEKVRKTKWRRFWIEKGAAIAVAVLIASFVLYFIGNWLYQTYKPPTTRDLDPQGIILHAFDAQNNLDTQELSQGFKKNISQYNEVLNLYVTATTRRAYEHIEAIIKAEDWENSGRQPIYKDTWVYGVIVQDVVETEENHYKASFLWYTPTPVEEEDEGVWPEVEGKTRVFIYNTEEEFEFKWNKRGWWECINSDITSYTLKEVVYADTYTN